MAKHLNDYVQTLTSNNISEAAVDATSNETDNTLTDNADSSSSSDVWSYSWRLEWLRKNNPTKYKQMVEE